MREDFFPEFSSEFWKTAAPNLAALRSALTAGTAAAKKQVGAVGSGIGVGALGGAVLGGAGKGVAEYSRSSREGDPGGVSAMRTLGAGLQGAFHGSLLGAGVGGLAGAAGGAKARELGKALAGREGAVGRAARFGQRQVHGLTGAVPEGAGSRVEAIRAMGAGAAPAKARLDAARNAMADQDGPALQKGFRDFVAARKGYEAASSAENLGMTSLPGMAKALATRPLEAARAAVGEQWHGGGAAHKAIAVGLPVAGAVSSVVTPSQPDGPGRAERTLGALAPLTGVNTLPLSGMIGAGVLASKALKTTGAGIDAKLRRRPE